VTFMNNKLVLYSSSWRGWKQKGSKCYWTKTQLEAFWIHTSSRSLENFHSII